LAGNIKKAHQKRGGEAVYGIWRFDGVRLKRGELEEKDTSKENTEKV